MKLKLPLLKQRDILQGEEFTYRGLNKNTPKEKRSTEDPP
jgi:hypothetical protein